MATLEVVRTYLDMDSPERQAGRATLPPGYRLLRLGREPARYRALYAGVGGDYHWRDRLAWTDEQITAHLAQPSVEVLVLMDDGHPRGFFELARGHDGAVEIAYFGLMPDAIGLGLGKALLTAAIDAAWRLRPQPPRVWLHTCTLDHPAALANYLGRGFRITRTERYTVDLPQA